MKQVMFCDVKDGQQFYDGKRWWIKTVEDSAGINAVLLGNNNTCCDFGYSCLVWLEK